MSVDNIQFWADTLEATRLPDLTQDVALLESRSIAAETLLSETIQSTTDRDDANSAATVAAQESADHAITVAYTALSDQTADDAAQAAIVAAQLADLRTEMLADIAQAQAALATVLATQITGELDYRLPVLDARISAVLAELDAELANLAGQLAAFDAASSQILDTVVPALAEIQGAVQTQVGALQARFDLFLVGFLDDDLMSGLDGFLVSVADEAAATAAAASAVSSAAAETFALASQYARDQAEGFAGQASSDRVLAQTANASAQSAKTAAALSETNALGSEAAAATSATNAATSAAASGAAATASQTSAGTATTKASEAGTSAVAAASSATAANTSAGNAQTSAVQSASSETNALGSKNAASTSAATAATQAGNAQTSATAAASSATAASASKDAASISATASQTSRLGAETAQGQALINKNDAATSATNAAGSASAASASATTAAGSATLSGDKAAAAVVSASAAQTSATAAASSATASGASATIANTKAGEASVSAGQAATSKTDAAGSATAASGSATTAASSAALSGTNATAAATSATAAATSKTDSAASANAAATSAVSASTASGTAGTHATNAATSATNALGSSNSAAISAGVAATSANISQLVGVDASIRYGLKSFSGSYNWASPEVATTASLRVTERDSTDALDGGKEIVAAGDAKIYTKQFFPINTARKYRLTARVKREAYVSGAALLYLGMVCLNANGTASVGSNGGHLYPVASGASPEGLPVGDFVQVSSVVTGASFNAGTKSVRLLMLANYGNVDPANVIVLSYFNIEDVTESEGALAHATASAASASTATTKATESGTSASTATTQANIATSQAGQANTSATNAATSATNSAGSASLALIYRNAAARQSSGGVSKNPVFNDWIGTYPEYVLSFPTNGTITKKTSGVKYVNALQMNNNSASTGPCIVLQNGPHNGTPNPERVLVRAEIEYISGSLSGLCFSAEWGGTAGVMVSKNIAASVVSTVGAIQNVEILLERPAGFVPGATPSHQVYLWASVGDDGGTVAACSFAVHRFDWEMITANSFADITQKAVTKVGKIEEAFIGIRAVAGSGKASFELAAMSDPTGPTSVARLAADNIILDGTVSARHVLAGSLTADDIKTGTMNAQNLSVTQLLKIDSGTGALSVGKNSAFDMTNDGIFFGRTLEAGGSYGFGLLAGKKIGGVDQYIQATAQSGLKLVNAAHYVSGLANPTVTTVPTSQTVTLPVGTKRLDLEYIGGGGGGAGATNSSSQVVINASNGTSTTVQLWNGTVNTGISWTAAGGLGATAIHAGDGGYAGANSSLGTGGIAGIAGVSGGNAGSATGYGAGGGGGGGTEKGGNGGGAASLISVENYDVSALANPKLVVVIGSGGAGSVGQSGAGAGGSGSPGLVKYTPKTLTLLPATVIPMQATFTGSLSKAASAKLVFPDYGAGLWHIWSETASGGMLLDYVETHVDGTQIRLTASQFATFLSDKTPVDLLVSATAVTYRYSFFKLGNWV